MKKFLFNKTAMNKFKKITKISALVLTMGVILTSCLKTNNNNTYVPANLAFIHAAPKSGSLDIIIDGRGLLNFNYATDTGYYAAYPGNRYLGVVKKDSTRYLATTTPNFRPGTNYSIFVADTLQKTSFVILEDNLTDPETDKAKIRFVNMSPDAPSLILQNAATSTDIFTPKGFKKYSDFTSFDPSETASFNIIDSGTTNVRATISNVKILKGKIYTIWVKGLNSQSDVNKFELSHFSHN